jgi:malate dehydrogenase
VPGVSGAGGVARVVDIDRNDDEKAMFAKSVASVETLIGIAKGLM